MRFFEEMTGPQRLVCVLAVVALSAVLIAYSSGGWLEGTLIGGIVLAILWLSSPVWKPPGDDSSTKIALTSLTLVSTVALAVLRKTDQGKHFSHGSSNH